MPSLLLFSNFYNMKKNDCNQIERSLYNLKSLKRYLISLSELTKSEEELEEVIKKLNIRILPAGSKQYVCESFFQVTDENRQFLEEINYGKWKFMLIANELVKKLPFIIHEIAIDDMDVNSIDASLPEIRERLNCRVLKLYSNGNDFCTVKEDELANLPNSYKRIGWSVSYKSYQEKGDDYDSFQV
jgi:hypothetical protein